MYDFLIFPRMAFFLLGACSAPACCTGTLTLSDPNQTSPRVVGFFHAWEDYIVISPFVLFSFEAFSRMCVSGLVLDPEVPILAIFTSPFLFDHSTRAASTTPVVHSTALPLLTDPQILAATAHSPTASVVSMGTVPDPSLSLTPDMTFPRPEAQPPLFHCGIKHHSRQYSTSSTKACRCRRNASGEDKVFVINGGDRDAVPAATGLWLRLARNIARRDLPVPVPQLATH
ncbi:hypothetical protein EI94DRAFT_1790779 [Lactarius quietus]|nr:hypothetical protein EI94DRAFT_1790779 [Lactarius quietus]